MGEQYVVERVDRDGDRQSILIYNTLYDAREVVVKLNAESCGLSHEYDYSVIDMRVALQGELSMLRDEKARKEKEDLAERFHDVVQVLKRNKEFLKRLEAKASRYPFPDNMLEACPESQILFLLENYGVCNLDGTP